jgi:rhodanese-related sulfurtransferase
VQCFAELPRERERVLVCQVGQRDLKATCCLKFHGCRRVAIMQGGLVKWVALGLVPEWASAWTLT